MEKALEKIIESVHRPMAWDQYNSTNVRNNTNCFSHAIGSTATSDRRVYRLGVISGNGYKSGKKDIEQEYFSAKEVKELFLSDLRVLELDAEEILLRDKDEILEHISNMNLQDNQYIVALFVKTYREWGKMRIRDFHFLRYDEEKGWSEKRFTQNVIFLNNIKFQWPSSWNDESVGVFVITR